MVRAKIINLLEENIEKHNCKLDLGNSLLDLTQKVQGTETKIDIFSSVQSLSAQSCPTLCDPKNRSTPGLPVHHQLPEFTQTHIH